MEINSKIKEEIIRKVVDLLPEQIRTHMEKTLREYDENNPAIQLCEALMTVTSDVANEINRDSVGGLKAIVAFLLLDMEDRQLVLGPNDLDDLEGYDISFQRTEAGGCVVKLVGLN